LINKYGKKEEGKAEAEEGRLGMSIPLVSQKPPLIAFNIHFIQQPLLIARKYHILN
jgi:hypothetical protein